GGSVWVANTDDHTVSRLDASTLELLRTIPLGVYPSDITSGAGGVWVVSGSSGLVLRIGRNNRAVKPISLGYTCRRQAAVTTGDAMVWVACDVPPGAFPVDPGTRSSKALF